MSVEKADFIIFPFFLASASVSANAAVNKGQFSIQCSSVSLLREDRIQYYVHLHARFGNRYG